MGSRQPGPDTDGLHSILQGATKPTLALRASVSSISKRGCTRLRTSSEAALFTPQLRSRGRRIRCDRWIQHELIKLPGGCAFPLLRIPFFACALIKPTTYWSRPSNVSEYEKAAWPPFNEIPVHGSQGSVIATHFPRMRCPLVTTVKVHVTSVSAVCLYFFHEMLALYQGK